MLLDIHHHGALASNAVNSIFSDVAIPDGGDFVFSIGLHPWHTEGGFDIDRQRRRVAESRVVMIGETGLDRLRGASLDVQESLFMEHIGLANEVGKPLIVHCVKAYDVLLRCIKSARVPVAVHGFRGKPEAALRLLDSGCYISFGERFNPMTVRIVPESRLLAETDESHLPIEKIIESLALCRNEETAVLQSNIAGNIRNILAGSIE